MDKGIISVVAMLWIAGCGTSGSQGGTGTLSEQASLMMQVQSGENISDPSTLPTSGRARYAGYSTLDLPQIGAQTGQMDLLVRFGDFGGSVTGSMHNFENLNGILQIGDGRLFRGADVGVDYLLGADVTGTLDDASGIYVIDAELAGDLRGRFQDGVTGVVFGTVTHAGVDVIFEGEVVGERTN